MENPEPPFVEPWGSAEPRLRNTDLEYARPVVLNHVAASTLDNVVLKIKNELIFSRLIKFISILTFFLPLSIYIIQILTVQEASPPEPSPLLHLRSSKLKPYQYLLFWFKRSWKTSKTHFGAFFPLQGSNFKKLFSGCPCHYRNALSKCQPFRSSGLVCALSVTIYSIYIID